MTASELPDAPIPDLLQLRPEPRPLWARVLLLIAGVLCLALGVVGWLVPVITGIPFYVLGAVLLGMGSPAIGRRINRWEARLGPRMRLLLRPKLRKQRAEQARHVGRTDA